MGLGITAEGAGKSGYTRDDVLYQKTVKGKYKKGDKKKLPYSHFQVAYENSSRTAFDFNEPDLTNGMKYLNDALDNGHPIMVGVNHTYKGRKHGIINEDTTDHYVVIIGRYCENGKIYYPYYDVGTMTGNLKSPAGASILLVFLM